jgi:hypothetical protein
MPRAPPVRAADHNVFINCPFDSAYRGLFEALLFTITASGYKVRCALEDDDAANIRFDKLKRLIRESPWSIHDLSRTELGDNALPRFNMPFELGLAMGAKYFGGKKQRRNKALVMVRERHTLPAYLSDLGGNDPSHHGDDPRALIRVVSRFLHTSPDGRLLPGPQSYATAFSKFKENLPAIAAALDWGAADIDPFANYRAYLLFIAEFMKTAKRVGSG